MKKLVKRFSVLFMAMLMAISTLGIPAAAFAAETDGSDYVYGTVNMNYADFYYGELEGIEPSNDTTIPKNTEDPVTKAGYREQGYYDAATMATPRGFIYEQKWKNGYPGSYSEPIIDEYGLTVGGRILGVKAVNVAVKKSLYDAALKAPKSVVGQKAAEITLNADQSQVPLSYKVLNADGVYSKYVNLTEPVNVALDGYLTTEFMGDDIWWEGKAMKHTDKQTILGGVIEYKKDPKDASEKPVVIGLKHDENMYSDTWIGWGMGPGNVGIYGGNETGWERFSGIAGNYLTKMSYILQEEDGSVHYYNATYDPAADEDGSQMQSLLHPYVPSAVVENGEHPYSAGITNYEFTKDRVKIDFEISVPLRKDGTREVDYYLRSLNVPGGSISPATAESNPEILPVYKESDWVDGKKTIHLEINRKYMSDDVEKSIGTGRYKYWIYVNKDYEKQEGDRYFTGVAQWKMLYTDETPDDIYLKANKLVVNSDVFTIEDYINNPYQQVEIYEAGKEDEPIDVIATGDANTNVNLFKGATKVDGTEVKGLFNKDGSINYDAQLYNYRKNRRTGEVTETVTDLFPDGKSKKYTLVIYSGGFPIVKGTLSDKREDPELKVASETLSKKFGDKAFSIDAAAKSALTYKSDNEAVASVSEDGKVTINGVGTCKIAVTAKETADYNEAVKEVTLTVEKGKPSITAKKSFKLKAKKLKKKAQTVKLAAKATSGGKITCKKKSGKKFIKVAKNGKITVKKGTKKGTYKVKILVKSAAKGGYLAGSKTFTVKIKVK